MHTQNEPLIDFVVVSSDSVLALTLLLFWLNSIFVVHIMWDTLSKTILYRRSTNLDVFKMYNSVTRTA